MTKFSLILILLIPGLIYGWKLKETGRNSIFTEPEISYKDTITDGSEKLTSKEYTLKNGKSIKILQEPESDYLVNVYVIGIGFSESQDTIFFDEIELIDTVITADINNDGYGELYIFTRGFFPGAYDHVFGVTSDEDKSIKEIIFADLKPSEVSKGALFDGYMGQDVYTFENDQIKRTFPVYNAGDFYGSPSRGYKNLYYTIEKTEKGFYFKLKD